MSQEQSALVPKNYSERKKENKRTSDTTYDRIYKYYHASKTRIELEDWEEEIRIRWEAAWFLLVRAKSQKDVADEMEKMFSISKSVAYDDVRHAMMLFGDPRQNMKPAKRAIAESIALKGLEFAEKVRDLPMMERFLQKYIDINGLKENPDAKMDELIKQFKAVQVNIVSTPAELEIKAKKMQDDLLNIISKKDETENSTS